MVTALEEAISKFSRDISIIKKEKHYKPITLSGALILLILSKYESVSEILKKIDEITSKYFEELKKVASKKTGLEFPMKESDENIEFLEKFCAINKIVEVEKIWSKYRKDYEKYLLLLKKSLLVEEIS